MSVQNQKKADECTECGTELPLWRKRHTDKCVTCGVPRCRRCGINVMDMETTANGGLCKPCSREVYGPGA